MVRRAVYQPDRGDFAWLDFSPQAGTEQAGRRPALVLSVRDFNVATSLAAVCPVTRTQTGSRFEVPISRGAKLSGVVLSHHFRTVDWLMRNAELCEKVGEELVDEVLGRIEAIMSFETL
jgi:mRNA interferase MazF